MKYVSKILDENGIASYTDEEQQTWSFLLDRQKKLVQDYASKEFILGVERLNLGDKIPQAHEVSEILRSYTGWSVAPVPALIQPEQFFSLLACKKFPAANFIRVPDEIDYIKEPDVFHEIFGHCPLLTNKPYSEFMHEYGKMALKGDHKTQLRMFRLFWFTIEFGLILEEGEFKAYGGGILSSKSEVIYSVTSPKAERFPLDAKLAFRTPFFRIDILQPLYYYIKSYDELFGLIEKDPFQMCLDSFSTKDLPAKFVKKNADLGIDNSAC